MKAGGKKTRRGSGGAPRPPPVPISTHHVPAQRLNTMSPTAVQVMRDTEERRSWGANRLGNLPLWVGSHVDALQVDELESRGIKLIVNCATECKSADGLAEKGIEVMALGWVDHCDTKIDRMFDEIAIKVGRTLAAGHGALIHCRAGISRASSTTTGVLMQMFQWDYNAAFDFVREYRTCAGPNLGFVLTLEAFDKIAARYPRMEKLPTRGDVTADEIQHWLTQFEEFKAAGGTRFELEFDQAPRSSTSMVDLIGQDDGESPQPLWFAPVAPQLEPDQLPVPFAMPPTPRRRQPPRSDDRDETPDDP